MKTSEATRKLSKSGCYFLEHGTNHDWWYSPITKLKFQVPRHQSQELVIGTKKSIERFSGIKL